MTIWVDAQLSPRTAQWISHSFGFEAKPLREIGLRDAEDYVIFQAGRAVDAVILTKDSDFVHLLEMHGSPPRILWLTCGNTSEHALQQLLRKHLLVAVSLLESGEELVEIGTHSPGPVCLLVVYSNAIRCRSVNLFTASASFDRYFATNDWSCLKSANSS